MTEVFNYNNPLNLIISFVMFSIGMLGATCNLLIIIVFIKEKSERTAFNLICFVRAISNVTILSTVFLGLFFPKTLLVQDNIVEVIMYTFIIMTCINAVTFIKVILFYWSRKKTLHQETHKRIERNMKLFFQTMLPDSLYLIDLTFTFKLSGLSTSRFWTFVSGTLVWEFLHSIDGFIMMAFNEHLSKLKKRFLSTLKPIARRRASSVSTLANTQ